MHLDPLGNVRVCELNSLAMLGNIASSSLIDLWRGRTNQRIRDALVDGSTAMGCEGCAGALEAGHRAGAHAAYYDRFQVNSAEPPWPIQLELSLSNACNLQCVMCNGDLSSAIRQHREHLPPLPRVYDEQFFADLETFLPHLQRVTFIGGEPLIGRESLRVLEMLASMAEPPEVQMSTNGTAWTPRIQRLFERLDIDVCVSLDALSAERYEEIRRGADHHQTWSNLPRLRAAATAFSVSYCLMTNNADEFLAFLRWADSEDVHAHVNVVTGPRRFSLYHLPSAELMQHLAVWDDDVAHRPLGLNQAVWERQRQRLVDHLRHAETTVALRPTTHESARTRAADRQAVEALLGPADDRVVIHLGISEEVIVADPPDGLGIDLTALVGGHLTALVAMLAQRFGELESSTIDLANGLEVRRFRYRGVDVAEIVAVQTAAGPDSPAGAVSTWHLGRAVT